MDKNIETEAEAAVDLLLSSIQVLGKYAAKGR